MEVPHSSNPNVPKGIDQLSPVEAPTGNRILVAEDDPTTQCLLKTLLAQGNYDVTVTSDGQEAWEHLTASVEQALSKDRDSSPMEEFFDVVICDWNMPKLTGIELVRKIRQHQELRLTFVILVTAGGGTQRLVTGLDEGADDYVTKPFKPAELLARVRAGVRIRRLQEDNAQLQHQLAALHLAATASHEINNPLMVLMGNWELLNAKISAMNDPEFDKRMERIKGAAQRIQGVANSLKKLRKIQLTTYLKGSKMIDLHPEPNPSPDDGITLGY